MYFSPVTFHLRGAQLFCVIVSLCLLLAIPFLIKGSEEKNDALVLSIDGTINPAVSDYIRKGFQLAAEQRVSLLIIRMNTPGGLDASMRDIIQEILSSPIAVVTYVWPDGARAASAGTYILYASHVAAMAPATNLGAATPIQIGGLGDAKDEKEDDPDAAAESAGADARAR